MAAVDEADDVDTEAFHPSFVLVTRSPAVAFIVVLGLFSTSTPTMLLCPGCCIPGLSQKCDCASD